MKKLIIWVSVLTICSIGAGIVYPKILILSIIFLFVMYLFLFFWILASIYRVREAISAAARGDYNYVHLALIGTALPLFPSILDTRIVAFLIAEFTDKTNKKTNTYNAQWQDYVILNSSGQKILSENGLNELTCIIEDQKFWRHPYRIYLSFKESKHLKAVFWFLFIFFIIVRTVFELLRVLFHWK